MKIVDTAYVTSAVAPSGYPPADRPEIAFAGRSNVGKSSLMNALLNRKKLVKTSATPGKTQTINFFDVNNAFRFVDLPGFGYAKVAKAVQARWGPMMDTYFRTRETLRAVVCLVDPRRGIGDLEAQLFAYLEEHGRHRILVFTKFDKLKAGERKQFARKVRSAYGLDVRDYFAVSTQTKAGLPQLWQEIDTFLTDVADLTGPADSVERED